MEAKLATTHWEIGDSHSRNLTQDELTYVEKLLPPAYKHLANEGAKVAVLTDNQFLVDVHMLNALDAVNKVNVTLKKAGMSRVWLFLTYKEG